MATKKTEIANATGTGVAPFGDDTPDYIKQGEGRGSENVGMKDTMLPRMELVQAQSPIKDSNPEAQEGFLFNTATMEVIGDLAYIIPIYYRMEYLVWKDQDEGGGFFGAYNFEDEAKARRDELISEGENPEFIEVVDTPVHYCLMVDPATLKTQQIVLSMSKSKARVSRKWNATIQIAGGDRFSRIYKVTSFKDKNKQNKTFWNYVVQPAGFPPKAAYEEAERLYEMFSKMGVVANHEAASFENQADAAAGHNTDAI